jgi:hypothetical protein
MTKQELIQQLDNEIAAAILSKRTLSYKEIGKLFGVSDAYVAGIAVSRKIRRPMGMKSPAWKRRNGV